MYMFVLNFIVNIIDNFLIKIVFKIINKIASDLILQNMINMQELISDISTRYIGQKIESDRKYRCAFDKLVQRRRNFKPVFIPKWT